MLLVFWGGRTIKPRNLRSIFLIREIAEEKTNAAIVKHGVFETCPSQTHSKLNMSILIRGTVVKKSDAAIAKHGSFEN